MRVLPKFPIRTLVVLCFVALACGFYFLKRWLPREAVEPFFSGLGPYTRTVTTSSPQAQKYFDQGLAFLYGYNYDEAIRSFEAAAASDPNCPMAFWGIAMANGAKVSDAKAFAARGFAAWKAAKESQDLADRASPVEQALIRAVNKRYDFPAPPNRKALDESYANAMRRVWKAHPNDPDVGALTAEAILRERRLDVCAVPGQPLPPSEEALQTLAAVLAAHPNHPYALHLLIHAVERSDHPERAKEAADRLRNFAPGLGHLTHMPTHIDMRCGDWHAAVIASEKAVAADRAYQRIVPDPGFYRDLMLHNNHMLVYVAAMQGQSQTATQAVREMLANIPDGAVARAPDDVDFYFAMPYELRVRFGQWDAMLAEPPPRPDFPLSTALWRIARGVAFAAEHQLGEAKFERSLFSSIRMSLPPGTIFRRNLASQVLDIAAGTLDGEILYREGKVDEGLALLREAVRSQDSLRYSEPPEWVQPARHALGAALMDAGRYAEAEAVYREDLVRLPENGWSLFGLSQSLSKQKKNAEAEAVTVRFKNAWRDADVKLTASCLCLPGKQ
jgi:tetratricopeptide (TPR) repeat protein